MAAAGAEEEEAEANKEQSAEEELLPGGWQDEEERARLLASCQPATPDEDRVKALLEIRDKATYPENWEPLWADVELRAALLACSDPPDPDFGKDPFADEEPVPPSDLTRTVALTVLVNLATSPANRLAMAEDTGVRNVFVCNADEDRPVLLRERVFLALCCIALGGACADPGDDHVPLEPPTPRACEVCGLCPCVCHAGEKVDRTSDMDVCNAMMLGAARGQPSRVRADICGTLCTLALSSVQDPSKVWANRRVRATLATCAEFGEPAEVRLSALGALWAFACCDLIQARMWREKEVREVLCRSAALEGRGPLGGALVSKLQGEEVRARALDALANLATERANRGPMWRDGQLAAALLQATAEGGLLRAAALKVLVELTKHWGNCARMAAAGVLDLLAAAAARDEALDLEERRQCGFARDRLQEAVDAARSGPWQP